MISLSLIQQKMLSTNVLILYTAIMLSMNVVLFVKIQVL